MGARSPGKLAASGTPHHNKLPYAHQHEYVPDLQSAIDQLRPTVLIGCAGQPEVFTEPVIRRMAELNHRPVIFALSNPTTKAECSAEQAYGWSDLAVGRVYPPLADIRQVCALIAAQVANIAWSDQMIFSNGSMSRCLTHFTRITRDSGLPLT